MRSKSTALMDNICSFVNEYYKANHQSPSINVIAKAVGVSKTTAYRYLVEMNEKGILRYLPLSCEVLDNPDAIV